MNLAHLALPAATFVVTWRLIDLLLWALEPR